MLFSVCVTDVAPGAEVARAEAGENVLLLVTGAVPYT
jgi:hypothetical protein